MINRKHKNLFEDRELLNKVGCNLEGKKTREQVFSEIINEYQTQVEKSLVVTKNQGLLHSLTGASIF